VSHPAIVHTELLLLALVTGSLAVTWVCRRLDISAPLLLVVVGIAASFIPGVETVQFDPNLVLFAVLTPLLYSAALESSFLGIRQNLRPIGLLAVGLPVFSAFAVGLVAWWVVPGLSLPAALVLGAVVAPPDAVSALSIGRRLGLPRRLMTIIGGESLVNDATALTLFRVFIAVAAGGGISILEGFGMFLLAAVGGTAIGLAIGWLVHKIRTRLADSDVESALGLIVPFGTYLVAELAHTSGVLAVVVAGLYLGYKAPQSGYATRLQEQAVWRAADTILESVVFALIGLQLTSVVAAAGDIRSLLVTGVVVTLAAIVARIVWVFPATYIPRVLIPAIGRRDPAPSWRVPAVISWSGMRGVVTLAAAFAIPETVPGRETIVFLAFFVTVATLLLHGLTLPTVIRKLGVREDGFQADVLAEAQTQFDAVQASISRLDELTAESDTYLSHTAEKLRRMAEYSANSVWERLGRPEEEAGESPSAAYRRLRREMLDSERTTFVSRRDSGDIDDEVLRRVLRRLDFEEAALARDDH
jgi:Na+/H+ antiporter